MQKNNKGFVLVETLLVSVFILTTLIFLFVQFRTVKQSYDRSFRYNTVTGMYAASNFSTYIKENSYGTLVDALNRECEGQTDCTKKYYLDLSNCPAQLLDEPTYCSRLKDTLNVDHIYFTAEDLSFLLHYLDSDAYLNASKNNQDINRETRNYIKTIKYDKDVNRYRLILEFKDNTYASIKVTGFGGVSYAHG